VAAGKKAFVVNVIGDVGLLLAIFLQFKTVGTLDYAHVLGTHTSPACTPLCGHAPAPLLLTPTYSATATAVALLLFVAAAAKSAQLPLHVWLPDAMEGPTPVSALIHAATMVTAGVYLVARAAPLYSASPAALATVGIVGGASALFAATIACVQVDIKRVLAYSTMSQLGYMFLGESAGGFSSGIFHLTTHAYFKALLFMCAGAVIHALAGEQDMRKMGGLRRRLTGTFWLFIVGGLALAAIPPFAGFWSKDAVLSAVLERGTTGEAGASLWLALYAVGLVTALLTGFYTFRLIFVVFLGQYRGGAIVPHGAEQSPLEPATASRRAGDPLAGVHEGGAVLLVPMVVLGLLALVGGLYGTPWANWIGNFLAPVTGPVVELVTGGALFWLSILLSLAAGAGGILLAWMLYGARQHDFAASHNWLVRFLEQRWYVDALYDHVLVRPTLALGRALRRWLEGVALDGGGRGVGTVLARTSAGLRALQTGYARNYAVAILLGAALILIYYVVHP
jgi:NADH-quinone oxidoreductase subunit L